MYTLNATYAMCDGDVCFPKQAMGARTTCFCWICPVQTTLDYVLGEGYGPDASAIKPFIKCPAIQTGPFLLRAQI